MRKYSLVDIQIRFPAIYWAFGHEIFPFSLYTIKCLAKTTIKFTPVIDTYLNFLLLYKFLIHKG